MSAEQTTKQAKTFTALDLIKSIPHYYFLIMGYILDGVQFLIKFLVTNFFKYLLIGLKIGYHYTLHFVFVYSYRFVFQPIYRFVLRPIGSFFAKLNKNKILNKVFYPFREIGKIFGAIPGAIIRFFKNLTMNQKKALTGWGFLSPWVLGFLALVAYPVGLLGYSSFNDVRQDGDVFNYTWVGFNNYHRILRVDIDFMMDVQDFIVHALLYTPVIIALAIIVAMLLNQPIKGKGFFRLVFFLPIIILNGELLSTMSDNGGMDIHISPFVFDLLTTIVPVFAIDLFTDLFSIIIEILWYTGVPILIFLSMLQKIDRSLYEAASIDGANAWSIFWKITLPIIRPAISVAVIFIVVFLANFDDNPINSLIIQSDGDPSRYQGYAAAMAIIYSIIQIFVVALLLLITRERKRKVRA